MTSQFGCQKTSGSMLMIKQNLDRMENRFIRNLVQSTALCISRDYITISDFFLTAEKYSTVIEIFSCRSFERNEKLFPLEIQYKIFFLKLYEIVKSNTLVNLLLLFFLN